MNTQKEILQLKTNIWRKNSIQPVETEHEEETDTLLLYFADIEREDIIITHYIDEHVFILYRQADNEIVGMGIEGFQRAFAPSYARTGPWKLSQTSTQIPGIKDMVFGVQSQTRESLSYPQPRHIRLVRNQEYNVSSEYAFA